MTEHDPIEYLLAQVREVSPSEEVRALNRDAVRTAMRQPTTTGWWHRSVAVPLPAALLTAAALLVSLSSHLFVSRSPGEPVQRPAVEDASGESNGFEVELLTSTDSRVEYSETQQYFSGVGVVDRNVIYKVKE